MNIFTATLTLARANQGVFNRIGISICCETDSTNVLVGILGFFFNLDRGER